MSSVIVVHGGAHPYYLRSCLFDANDGLGAVEWTSDLLEAKRFPDNAAALAYYRTQSTVQPLRPDGKPNRPLTAYTVEIRRVID